jgi:hypothetical protein
MAQLGFEQAKIPVQKQAEYEEFRGVIQRVFAPAKVEKFLKRLEKAHIRVRDFESALARGHFERVDEVLGQSGRAAKQIYESLPTSDQAQIRELYLSALEQVEDRLRSKFREIYR